MTTSAEGHHLAKKFNIPIATRDADEIFADPQIDAVLICSPTNTHADYVIRAARAAKAVFCEKPLDLSIKKVKETLAIVDEQRIPLMLAFNQRFDPSFAEIKDRIKQGHPGRIHSIHIISRDPAPPPISYIANSGGMFMDMTIHDFDMARFLLDSEVTEVFAKGKNLIDEKIRQAGDIDTALAVLSFENNATVVIENSRKASYGYDQRLEVFGSNGMMRVDNPLKNTAAYFGAHGGSMGRHPDFFMDRYAESYLVELRAFLAALRDNTPMPVSGIDGLKAMLMADAANRSMKEGRPVSLQ
jgi:myo-inositol 2-dehydrogenase/D-chiro-inositol 1-dehydrogenase